MKVYKFIASYDIQDENGVSILKDKTANAIGLDMTQETLENFNFTLCRMRLEKLANHLYCCGLLDHLQKDQHQNAKVEGYKNELQHPRIDGVNQRYLHAAVIKKGIGYLYNYLKETSTLLGVPQPWTGYDADIVNSWKQKSEENSH